MKYDDSEYCFLNFETDLDNHAADTHIGMYLAWAMLTGLSRDADEMTDWAPELARLEAREVTGADLLSELCDGKLTDEDFNAEGNLFTAAYYEEFFVADYCRVFADQIPDTGHSADDLCSVPNTWANFDKLKPLLDRRYAAWKSGRNAAAVGGAGKAAAVPDIASLRQRAAAGDANAWYELAAEYITGERLPRDFKQAADAFEKAAQGGIPEGAYNLGVCYQNGDGRPQDAQQRLRWFALAAEGGHGQAAYHLALAYRQGDPLPQDFVASNALMLLAQRRGVDEARQAGIMAGSTTESFLLAEQLNQPGQLVALLSARRRKVLAGQAETGVERWKNGPSRPAPAAEPDPAPERPSVGFGWGHLALLIGASATVVLLLSSLRGPRFIGLSWLLSLIGAAGVFQVGPTLGLNGIARGLMTALAVVPALGSFVNLWLVVRWAGRRWG